MKTFLLTLFLFSGILGSSAFANPLDIEETSPDGKWFFKAQWFGDRGYTWQLENTITKKTFFAEPHPAADEALPHRLNVLWSPGNHYLAINVYYGRICYGVDVIALNDARPTDHTIWPMREEASMIKAEDRKIWTGTGIANCSAEQWITSDTLVLDYDMRSELVDKTAATKFRIDSTRQVSIQFSGLKGKVVKDQPPEYEKQPEP